MRIALVLLFTAGLRRGELVRLTLVAYFRPSRTAFQADRGRCFRLIADGISA
jgi:site-specific recombinase XerD